jgi:hypothetical protein
MTIRRDEDVVLLEGVCAVEDAEVLMHELQAGATLIDWSACAHLHTACLQVLLAAGLPVRGAPANAAIARWLAPALRHVEPSPVVELEATGPGVFPDDTDAARLAGEATPQRSGVAGKGLDVGLDAQRGRGARVAAERAGVRQSPAQSRHRGQGRLAT